MYQYSNIILSTGTGKTTVAGSIAFGFVHQCRTSTNLPKHSKVLATAFSNVGADNLAEQLLRVGLKVVRVGKASAVSQGLWDVSAQLRFFQNRLDFVNTVLTFFCNTVYT